MSQIKTSLAVVALVFGLILSGCGDRNNQAIFNSDNGGTHPDNWLENHWVEYNKTAPKTAKLVGKGVASVVSFANSPCAQCHGADLMGGVSKVSCFSASIGATGCHADGPMIGHPVGWESNTNHGLQGAMALPAVSAGFAYCARCHGSTFDNGNAVSCLNSSCHVGGDKPSPHPPAPWHGTTTSGSNHVFTDPANAEQCDKCHRDGQNLNISLRANTRSVGTAPGCFNNTLCHGKGHASANGWNDPVDVPSFHGTAARNSFSCSLCHGATLSGSAALGGGIAPSCANTVSTTGLQCHSNGTPVGLKTSGCSSCHGNGTTPNGTPNGAAFPNFSGSHRAHVRLPSVITGSTHSSICDNCHSSGGTGTVNHAKGTVNLLFDTKFKAKAAAANPVSNQDGTCSDVSCHGGQSTPVWGGASPACVNCHALGAFSQEKEYNNYYSGQHKVHVVDNNLNCTDCHSKSKLTTQQHFGGLVSHQFTSPGNTVGMTQGVTNDTKMGTYNQTTQTCNGVSCHPLSPNHLPADGNKWISN